MMVTPPNSTRISKRFAELRASGELGIVAYIVAGDPSLEASLKYVLALAEGGADFIELGVPFSDPLADGPTIQRASERALKSGTTLAGVPGAKQALPDDPPALLRRSRAVTELPIAVGFGISLPGHVSVLGGLADAAVIGSALVSEIESATKSAAPSDALTALGNRIHALKEAARHGLSRREVAP